MLDALILLLTWPYFGWAALGTMVALFFGTLPGLNGVMATALVIPFTFSLPADQAIILLSATVAGGTFGGAITAILINTPGDAINAATAYDGHPLAKQGRAGYAIGAACMASALGSLLGLFVLLLVIPLARMLILALSYPELFLITCLGLVVVTVVSRGNMLKGLIIVGFGLLISFIGLDPYDGRERFFAGTFYLWDGIPLIPVTIGIFALAEGMKMIVSGKAISTKPIDLGAEAFGQVKEGFKAVFINFGVFLRSSLIGTIIGAVPGLGGIIANFMAYSHAVQTAKDKSKFGKGDIRGVIASEASNDAKDGGALIPTLAFGIPGSASMAVLLGALIFHGVAPGNRLLTKDIDIVYMIIAAMVLASILTSVIGVVFIKRFMWLTIIDTRIMAGVIIALSLTGSYALNQSMGDVTVTVLFGFIAIMLGLCSFPVTPLLIGLILGSILEIYLHNVLEYQGIENFYTRPISLMLMFMLIATLLYPAMCHVREVIRSKKTQYGDKK